VSSKGRHQKGTKNAEGGKKEIGEGKKVPEGEGAIAFAVKGGWPSGKRGERKRACRG